MKRLVTALLTGMCLVVLMAGAVAAYDVPIDNQVTISGACPSGENLRATVVNSNGQPVAGQTVTWTISSSPSAGDTLRDTSTTTDANGVTTNSIDVDTAVTGKRVITVTTGDASAKIALNGKRVITVTAGVITVTAGDASARIELNCGTGGLPRTDTAPASTMPIVMSALLAVILFAAAGLVRRRVRV